LVNIYLFNFRSPSDTYITVVYNDETHTFDYVIKVLQRAVSCPANQASDYATIIDREVGWFWFQFFTFL